MTTSTSVPIQKPADDGDGATEVPDRTLRVLVVADLSATSGAKVPVAIDREGFDEAVRALAPRFQRVGGNSDPTAADADLDLGFDGWRDFTPAGLAEREPLLAALLRVREVAQQVGKGEASPDDLSAAAQRELPQAWASRIAGDAPPAAAPSATPVAPQTTPTAATGSGDVDSLLSMVDAPSASPAGGTKAVADRLVAEVTAGKGQRRRAKGKGPAAAVDALIAERLDSIIGDDGFRKVEAAWRGLRLLVQRTDFRSGVRMDCLSVDAEELPAALAALESLDEYDFVVAACEFDASTRDCERAAALAEAAALAQTTVLASVAPAFFGLASWAELGNEASPRSIFEGDSHTGWRALREDERARSLVLVANRIALRAPYGPDGEPSRGLRYAEGDSRGLFGNSALGLASVLVRAFAETGACIRVSGTRHGLISDLALLGEGRAAAPVEGGFGRERIEELESLGLAVVAKYQRDIAFVGTVRTFRKADKYPDPEATADSAQQVLLAYQLITKGFVRELQNRLPDLVGSGDREALSAGLHTLAVEYFSAPGAPLGADHAAVRVDPNENDPSLTDIVLRVQPEIVIGNRPLSILLQFALAL